MSELHRLPVFDSKASGSRGGETQWGEFVLPACQAGFHELDSNGLTLVEGTVQKGVGLEGLKPRGAT